MGGVRLKSRRERKVPSGEEKTVVDPAGILLLAQLRLLPALTKVVIDAKSKTERLAKFLVVQVSWTIVHIMAWLIEWLPITILEMFTVAQVACALILYGIWWYKPQGQEDPIIIDLNHYTVCKDLLKRNHFD
jgi:hypothetical protein